MFCRNCGKELGATDRFCGFCGTPTNVGAPAAEAPKAETPKVEAPKTEAPKTEAPNTGAANYANTESRIAAVGACQNCGINIAAGCTVCPKCGAATQVNKTGGNRSKFSVPLNKSVDDMEAKASQLLTSHGYHLHNYHGESVWKKGTGLMTAMEYVKLEYSESSVEIYGWIQPGVGNAGLKESDLNGIVGVIPKKSVKKVIDELMAALA